MLRHISEGLVSEFGFPHSSLAVRGWLFPCLPSCPHPTSRPSPDLFFAGSGVPGANLLGPCEFIFSWGDALVTKLAIQFEECSDEECRVL